MPAELPLTIKDAAAELRAGTLTSLELTQRMLARIDALQETLGAFVSVTRDGALEQAETADANFAAGVDHGPLQGIPLAIKDIISVAGTTTTANSHILAPDWGGGVDATVAARLRGAGAVVVGKSTTNEFALGMPDPDKGFPMPHNPWNTEHTAGGSSSGTGVAVSAGLALGGLGTDTGGSVRFPAAVNGHTGLKVTFGRVPKSGVVPLGYSLDSVGPHARSAYDCALLLEVMAGYDPTDPNCADVEVTRYSDLLTGSVEGTRVGVPKPYFFDADGLDADVRDAALAAVALLGSAGASVTDTEVPGAKMAKEANGITLSAEAFAYHRNNLVGRWETYGKFTRMGLGRGALFSSADYTQAQRFRAQFRRDVFALFDEFDVLVTPGWPTAAPRIVDMTAERMVYGPNFTGPWNFAGLPAVVLPSGFSANGLPLSIQIIGRPFAEGAVLTVAHAYQQLTEWHLAVPPLTAEADNLIATAARR